MAVASQMFACRSKLDSQIKADQIVNSLLKIMNPMTSQRDNLRRTDAHVHADANTYASISSQAACGATSFIFLVLPNASRFDRYLWRPCWSDRQQNEYICKHFRSSCLRRHSIFILSVAERQWPRQIYLAPLFVRPSTTPSHQAEDGLRNILMRQDPMNRGNVAEHVWDHPITWFVLGC